MSYVAADKPVPGKDADGPQAGKHLAIALVVAAALVWSARTLTDQALPGPTAAQTPSATTAVGTSAPATAAVDTAEEERLAAVARAERQRREQAAIDAERARREAKKAEVMRARDEAAAASQAEEARKEAAWRRYFTPSRKCDAGGDDASRVECSNQYIRAKERFERLYAEGKLR